MNILQTAPNGDSHFPRCKKCGNTCDALANDPSHTEFQGLCCLCFFGSTYHRQYHPTFSTEDLCPTCQARQNDSIVTIGLTTVHKQLLAREVELKRELRELKKKLQFAKKEIQRFMQAHDKDRHQEGDLTFTRVTQDRVKPAVPAKELPAEYQEEYRVEYVRIKLQGAEDRDE